MESWRPWIDLIPQAMLRDQYWLHRQVERLRRSEARGKTTDPHKLQAVEQRLRRSLERRQWRAEHAPAVSYPADLPIAEHHAEIADAIQKHQVIVVSGETGSGKSTQLPKICLDAGLGRAGMIGHTQPRRIAARAVAARVAEELDTPLGEAVGYKIRFQDKTNPNSFVKLMTDGMLLAETASDPYLRQYEVIILDEAHERSLNVDFLIGILHRLVRRRPELRLIITSATIDAERFAEHFGQADRPAPILGVAGRTFPVEVRYRPLDQDDGDTLDVNDAILLAVKELRREGGDVLVFLPTERDIREAAKRLRADRSLRDARPALQILPLYARLSNAEQNRIFHPDRAPRIVLATNVAESSLTVPRIHSVIDTGTARISRYSPRLRIQRLPIESISQASADQRKGRCGRLGPGICIRLYGEQDYDSRPPFTTPEIRRTNLASVILQAQYLRLGDIGEIPFLDPPRPETIREGYKTLFEIGAVDDQRLMTPLGRTLARLPVDPRIGRTVLAALDENCLAEVLIIAAALEVQDPRLRPLDQQQAADQHHAKFADERSDFMSFLKLWDYVGQLRDELSRSQFSRRCQKEFLSLPRLREWSETHRQLRESVRQHGSRLGPRRDDQAAIHRALLTGLLSCIAYRSGEFEYTGAGGKKFQIWPGSALFRAKPKWIMAAELVETNRRYGRIVATIDPRWLERLGDHLVKRTYSDPHWHAKRLAAMVFERITLFGLPIVPRRRVPLAPIDPSRARQLFIEHGLVGQDMEIEDGFFRHNQTVLKQVASLAAKTRRREFVLDDYRVHAFYAQRLPDDVVDMASLRQRMKSDRALRKSLRMTTDDLLATEDELPDETAYPDRLDVGSMRLPMEYHFEPGTERDGLTVTLPTEALSQVTMRHAEWLVPGLLEDKLLALLRSLPKPTRRQLMPLRDTARRVAKQVTHGKGVLLEEAARAFSNLAQVHISTQDFQLTELPNYLKMRFQVVDAEGEVQAASRDLAGLRKLLDDVGEQPVATRDDSDPWRQDGLTTWEWDEVPVQIQTRRGGIDVALFPAVVDQDDAVGLRLLDTPVAAHRETRAGLRRLYQLINQRALRTQVRWLPEWEQCRVWMSARLTKSELENELRLLLADRAFLNEEDLPRNREEFQRRQDESGSRIAAATQDVAQVAPPLMEAYHRCRLALERIQAHRWTVSRDDIQQQLSALLHARFLTETPWHWLAHFPRYLRAIEYRIDKLTSGGQAKDEANLQQVQRFWRLLDEHPEDRSTSVQAVAEWQEFRWMIEELRVSLFAQPLGTSIKTSPQRLEKQWHKVSRG